MKCIFCEEWSFSIICETCQDDFLKPSIYHRRIKKGLDVYSFYNYDEIQDLLKAKYYFFGDRILNILGSLAFAKFAKEFSFTQKVIALPIDDHTRHEFSHTAILSRHLNSQFIKPIYNHLRASNIVQYAGKKLEYRKTHPRDLILKDIKNEKIILVDDLLTSGTTLKEAFKVCSKNNEVLFALCLADANHKN